MSVEVQSRSRLKRDSTLGRALAVCLTSPSGATLMRAQRVALSFLCFFAQSKEFRQLLPSRVHPSCGRRPHVHLFLQSRRFSEVHLGLCQLGHKIMRRPTRILLANVDPFDTEKLHRSCHGANFTCSHSVSAHRKISEPAPSPLPAEICHFLVQAGPTHVPRP